MKKIIANMTEVMKKGIKLMEQQSMSERRPSSYDNFTYFII